MRGRVQVVETPHALLLTNVGAFLPGRVEVVIDQDAPLEIYRNPYLAEAMVSLNMIDTQGGGIKRMFQAQRSQYYRDMIVALVREHQPVARQDIDKLLLDKLPEVLSESQKVSKVHNLITALSGKAIKNVGTRQASQWVLIAENKQ